MSPLRKNIKTLRPKLNPDWQKKALDGIDTIQVFEQNRKRINKANCPVHAAKHRRHLTTN